MVKVFYRDEQTVDAGSFSKSPLKPKLVVEDWASSFQNGIELCSFPPLTREDLYLAHSPVYVDEVLRGERRNGFGNTDFKVAYSLPYTSGSMVSAAYAALDTGIAVSPTSGFHHAAYSHGGAFCTFNGLMITVQKLIKEKGINKVGILDCDYHYGNGTSAIIEELDLEERVHHFTSGAYFTEPKQATEFLRALPSLLDQFLDCDLVLYQAGADPHIEDPLGGFLTTKQLSKRDTAVFKFFKKHTIPLAFNLAGGYQTPLKKVIAIHHNTMKACIESYT